MAQQRMATVAGADILLDGAPFADVPVVPQSAENDTDDGTERTERSIHVWLSKADHSARPEMRQKITYDGLEYSIYEVGQDGPTFANWFIRASRHAA